MPILNNLSVWQSDENSPPLLEVTLADVLRERAALDPEAMALIFENFNVRWTYSELQARADRMARGLFAWGVRHGDRVALLSPNCPDWVVLEYALARLGAVLVTANPAYRTSEIGYLLKQARVSALITVTQYRGYDIGASLTELMPYLAEGENPALRHVQPSDLPDMQRVATFEGSALQGATPLSEIAALGDACNSADFAIEAAKVTADDIAQIQYTSGTTGAPKGAMLRHRGIVNNGRLLAMRGGFQASDILVSAMPFFHTAGCVCNVIGMVSVGGCLVGMPEFNAREMLGLIDRCKGTVINAVPTMLIRLLEDPDMKAGKVDISSLRICFTGGTTIQPKLMREIHDLTGAEPMIIMGMTECSPIITQTSNDDDFDVRISTAGTPLPHTDIKIVDTKTGAPVPLGQSGELMIRGYLVTAGYFDMPEKTAEALNSEGWFHSGDLAELSASGHLRIVGRLKDMLIRGGENIYPAEIEAHLLTHSGVSDAQVVGVPDPQMGEEICAMIVIKDGHTLTESQIDEHCLEGLSRHKKPKYVLFTKDFPMTNNGKIQKYELQKVAACKLGLGL